MRTRSATLATFRGGKLNPSANFPSATCCKTNNNNLNLVSLLCCAVLLHCILQQLHVGKQTQNIHLLFLKPLHYLGLENVRRVAPKHRIEITKTTNPGGKCKRYKVKKEINKLATNESRRVEDSFASETFVEASLMGCHATRGALRNSPKTSCEAD